MGSAGVTRPDRPGLDLSKQPPAVRLNKELDYILTYKLKVTFSPTMHTYTSPTLSPIQPICLTYYINNFMEIHTHLKGANSIR